MDRKKKDEDGYEADLPDSESSLTYLTDMGKNFGGAV
jgi:hypothetical protein